MRKIAAVLLIAALVAPFVFADDALTLPQGAFRFRLAPSYSMTSKMYDPDGEAKDFPMENTVTAMSGSFELGVMEPVTFGVKWAPGYYVANSFADETYKNYKLTGPADLEIGAKLQLVGASGFVRNEAFRFALTPGFSLPLDNYDAKAEFEKASKGEAFRPGSSSGHQSMGAGIKADADYAINDMFFFNVHGELFYYTPAKYIGFETYMANAMAYGTAMVVTSGDAAAAKAMADAAYPLTESETAYGFEYAAEFEPHAKFSLSKTASVSVGLPVTYAVNLGDITTYNEEEGEKTENETVLKIGPKVSAFMMLGPLPFEAEVQYTMPVIGENTLATSTVSLQLRFFGKLF